MEYWDLFFVSFLSWCFTVGSVRVSEAPALPRSVCISAIISKLVLVTAAPCFRFVGHLSLTFAFFTVF